MSLGRRGILSLFGHLVVVVAVASTTSAHAQQESIGSHEIWNQSLTEAQIRAALGRLSMPEGDLDPIQKLLRDRFLSGQPHLSREQVEQELKKLTSNKQFMERARQLAKDKITDPGRRPNLSQEDLTRLFQSLPPGISGGPPNGKVPPDMKLGDPKLGDPKAGGSTPTPGIPALPKLTPPGTISPPGVVPAPPAPPKEDALFRPADEPTDPRSKSLQAFAAMWERNIGPLDQTPEVRKALFDLATEANGLDLDLKDEQGNSLWDLLRKGESESLSFGNFMEGSEGSFRMPSFDFPSFRLGQFGSSPRISSPSSSNSNSGSGNLWRSRSSSSGGSSGLGNFSFGGAWFPVIVLGVVILGILVWVLLKNMRKPTPEFAFVADGLGPWPVDPRRINTREDVVKAFEYLSVLICGPSARNWTHGTIADSLAELAATQGETAAMLARLYELARYAPLDEPLSREELTDARELVCDLAGVTN